MNHQPENTPKSSLRLFLTGMAMGTADVIPGVSGGTIAFILGIYEELINAIKSFDVQLVRLLVQRKITEALDHVPWRFLLALFLGIGTAIFSLAHLVSWLLENQPVYLFSTFFGLILASVVAVAATIPWSLREGIAVVGGTIAALIIVNLVPLDMSHDPITLFLSGMVAIMAMILPGISGSFILLILGQYNHVLNAVKELDIVTIAVVGAGAAVGLMGFARILSWLLKRYHEPTIAALVGFMVGSLWKIWPWKVVLETRLDRHGEEVPIVEANVLPAFASTEFLVALALCIVGFFVVCVLDHLQSQSNPVLRRMGFGRRTAPPVRGRG